MARLLLIGDDAGTTTAFGILRTAGHFIVTARSGQQGLVCLERWPMDLVVTSLCLPDISGFEFLQRLRGTRLAIPVVMVTEFGSIAEAVTAMRLGAADFLETPIVKGRFLKAVDRALAAKSSDLDADVRKNRLDQQEAHAAARWARRVVAVIDAPQDPRTVAGWGRMVFASPGALRNWCRTAGMSPRRSLVFARLLRAAFLSHHSKRKPENLLDVVDQRTLLGLFRMVGFKSTEEFPADIDAFLHRQALVRDPDMLLEIKRAIAAHRVSSQRRRATAVLARREPIASVEPQPHS